MVYDIIVETLFEEDLQGVLKTLGAGRLIMDPDDPNEPYLTREQTFGINDPGGWLIVRLRDRDPYVFARELERRTSQMRVVRVVDRTILKTKEQA